MANTDMISAFTTTLMASFDQQLVKQAMLSDAIITGEIKNSNNEHQGILGCECRDNLIAFTHGETIYLGKHDSFKRCLYTSFKTFHLYVQALLHVHKFNDHLGEWYGNLPLAKAERVLLTIAPDGALLIVSNDSKKTLTLNLNDDMRSKRTCLQFAFTH